MSSRKRIFIFSLLILLSALLILYSSCSKNSTGNQVSFGPGSYKGTYTVIRNWGTANQEDPKVDTMIFKFISPPDSFRMEWFVPGGAHRFCEANGAFRFGNDSLTLMRITKVGGEQCNPDEIPQGQYDYSIDHSTIIFRAPDSVIYRRIELWQKL